MCGVSVLCVDGDTAHAVSLSFVLMETPHMRCLCPLCWWRHRTCGVSVLCVGGDTACAVSLSVVWLETFVCACFSYRYFHVIVVVLSVFFIIVYIFLQIWFCIFY